MPREQKYKNGQNAKMYAQRLTTRKRMDGEYRYPFGLLSIVDLMDRVFKTKRRRAGKKAA
jgi:hypothetical protein